MKMRKTKSTTNAIEIIEHIESQLSTLKKALKEIKPIANGVEGGARSVREYEFCGMWKDREDMRGLSSTEWLLKLRREQWGRI
jgi:hypothetical protein